MCLNRNVRHAMNTKQMTMGGGGGKQVHYYSLYTIDYSQIHNCLTLEFRDIAILWSKEEQ